MAISTARNVLAGIDATLDPSMVVNREVLRTQGRVPQPSVDDAVWHCQY
jgi:hypothetical protein